MSKSFSIIFTLLCFIACGSCKKMTVETPKPTPVTPLASALNTYAPDKFVMGSDLSYANQVEDYGGVFKDSGKVKDVFRLFKERGNNLVRVRLWHSPTWTAGINNGKQYSDLQDVEKTIRRAKAEGMHVNLDVHYSDTWADPSKQGIPKAWEGLSLAVLKDSVYQYTFKTLKYLESRNLTPEMIQIGNENNGGMLWPLGKIVNNDFKNFADLLKSGIQAVRDFSKTAAIKPQIVLHCAQLDGAEWWSDGVITKGGVTDFDIIGLSHYYKWAKINTMADIGKTIAALKTKYGKKVMIVETAFSWTSADGDGYGNIMSTNTSVETYPISQAGQLQYMRDLTQTVISAGGSGIQYWEPAWISSNMKDLWGKGSSWDNNTLFDFSGNALPAFEFMTAVYKF